MSTPRTALKGTSLMIDVVVTQTGYAGETVTLDVEDEGRIVGSQEVKLPVGRRAGGGARAVHGVRGRSARVHVPDRAAGRASWSPRTTRARR